MRLGRYLHLGPHVGPGRRRRAGGGGGGSSVALREHLSASAKASAEAIAAVFDADWAPDLTSISWDDTVAIADGGELYRWLRNNLSIGGVTLNPARNQRLQLAAGGDFSYGAANQTGGGTAGICELRGRDYLAAGKVLLIEPATTSPNISQRFTISGSRGIYFRNLNLVGGLDNWSLDWANYAPLALASLTVTAGGTGYATGQSLVFAGSYDDAPVGTIIASAGAVTGVDITYGGRVAYHPTSGTSQISSVTVSGGGSGATFTVPTAPTNPRDTTIVNIQRNSSFPLLPVIVFDGCNIGKGHVEANPQKYGTGLSCINAEQFTVKNCVFNGYQTALKPGTVRRYRVQGCDFKAGIGDVSILVNTNVNTAVGAGQTYGTVYPDGLCYAWLRLNTARAVTDDCARVNAQGEELRLDQEHTDFSQFGTSGDTGGYKRLVEFNAVYFERETYKDRNSSYRNNTASTLRVTGGTQGTYEDDCGASLNIDGVVHSNIIAVQTPNAYTTYNGTSYLERNTGVRVGRVAPSATVGVDGFNYSQDHNPDITTKKKDAGASASVTITDNIAGGITNIAAPQNATQTLSGNVTADARLTASAGTLYTDVFTGTFGTVNGLTGYTFTDDGAASQSAFRAALYSQFTPKGAAVGKGAPDPSLWPVV